ncbi:hypothetical protein, partial [Burkholderia vietnamiensis]|uniref:hypothetical protein n=1 Tax=Burkholderia vietnamiensis TaxID=60552 RepID=UPI001E5C8AE5
MALHLQPLDGRERVAFSGGRCLDAVCLSRKPEILCPRAHAYQPRVPIRHAITMQGGLKNQVQRLANPVAANSIAMASSG